MKVPFVLLLFFICATTTFSQNESPQNEVFRSDQIPTVEIFLPTDSLYEIFHNLTSNHHFQATFIFDNGSVRDTLENVGLRLRGHASRYVNKKSWKISFNTYVPGRKYYGLKKMNLNGQHNDPTVVRTKLAWDIARQSNLVGARCNHVALYINDEYYGVYANVEQIDEEFLQQHFGNDDGDLYKCLFPADLAYLGDDPNLYKFSVLNRRVYELKNAPSPSDYSTLSHFIDVLNNTPTDDFLCEIEQVFNVNEYLKYIAFDILIGNWDGPIFNKNNFYLYENTATGRMEYLPYDLDNTFGLDWEDNDWAQKNIYKWSRPDEPRPIYTKMMEHPELRRRFSFYLQKMMKEVFYEEHLFPLIDSLKVKVDPYRWNDSFAKLDHGFDFEDYEHAFDHSLWGHVKAGLKQYIHERIISAKNQKEIKKINPIIARIQHNHPNAYQELLITTQVEDDDSIQMVQLIYQLDNQSDWITQEMFDDGAHHDGEANDGIYGIIIPPLGIGTDVNYYVEVFDVSEGYSRYPNCVTQQMTVEESSVPLFVNEIMSSNKEVIADDHGEYDDWVEIYNGGDAPIFLGDKYLSDKIDNPSKWKLPNVYLPAKAYLLIWADDDPSQGDFHTNFKLNAAGEFIGIFENQDNDYALIDGFHFGAVASDQVLARLPDGVGIFQMAKPTPSAANRP
ncbi:MAG: CotH kinase family protein, partial [Bacteroidota bacterium]